MAHILGLEYLGLDQKLPDSKNADMDYAKRDFGILRHGIGFYREMQGRDRFVSEDKRVVLELSKYAPSVTKTYPIDYLQTRISVERVYIGGSLKTKIECEGDFSPLSILHALECSEEFQRDSKELANPQESGL